MAHIKVTRRSMRPEEWINLRFGWLKRYIYKEKHEIDSFVIKDARQVSEMNFEFYENEFRPLQLFAFVGIDENKKVVYSYYSKTIGDFPDINEIIERLK